VLPAERHTLLAPTGRAFCHSFVDFFRSIEQVQTHDVAVQPTVRLLDATAQISESDVNKAPASKVSADNHRSSRWERKLDFDGAQLIKAQYPDGSASVCYTPARNCALLPDVVAAGAPCWCPIPYYPYQVWGTGQ
jgi:hypothetical protein